MPNFIQAFKGGQPLPDAVTVFVDGSKVFNGWKDLSVQKNLDSLANSFSMTVDNKFIDSPKLWPLRPGVSVAINIGDERVMTGFIDTMDISFSAGNRTLSFAGRSKNADLVDCSVSGAGEFNNITIDKLAEQLIAPFGLRVFLSVEVGDPFEKFALKPGETYFTALDRAARLKGFMWISTRAGNLRLTKRAKARSYSELSQDFNLLSASVKYDNSQRFSEYNILGQRPGNDSVAGALAATPTGKATDAGITRFRPLTIIAENSIDAGQAATRAGWEASLRVAKGMQIEVDVQGWRQEDGSLWGINQLVRLRSSYLGVNSDFLIASVEHTQSNSEGTITKMNLVRPDSFESKPKFEKKDDLISQLKAQ